MRFYDFTVLHTFDTIVNPNGLCALSYSENPIFAYPCIPQKGSQKMGSVAIVNLSQSEMSVNTH